MKLKAVLISAIAGLALVGCNDSDISGIYSHDGERNVTITKSKDGKTFIVDTGVKFMSSITNKEEIAPYREVTYEKDSKLYKLNNDQFVGEVKGNDFIFNENKVTYTKKN